MFCKKQSGPKDYMDLFQIINKDLFISNPESIRLEFIKRNPDKSFENTAQYLLKLVTDSLIHIRTRNDKQFQQYFSLMRAKVLFERSISKEGFKELKKAQKLANSNEDNLALSYGYSQELSHLSELGFPEMTEDKLIETHMKIKKNLRQLHQIQEHSSLYQLLRYRLLHSKKSLSTSDKTKLNDLIITELSIITRGSPTNFETQKTHLLFQSFFLMQTGEYQSSIKSFKELNELFESKKSLWKIPPYDYLNALEGILDNLRSIADYDEMKFFIKKIEKLLEQKYPEHFQAIAKQTVYIYKLNILIEKGEPSEAIQFSESIPAALTKNENLVNYEKRAELLFFIALCYFCSEDYQKAKKQINTIKNFDKMNVNSNIHRVSWLLQILIYYELDDLLYLDYEIRSYKRTFKKNGGILKTENLVFKMIKHDPRRKNKLRNIKFLNRIAKDIPEIRWSNYERQILKYYDFISWIFTKLNIQ